MQVGKGVVSGNLAIGGMGVGGGGRTAVRPYHLTVVGLLRF